MMKKISVLFLLGIAGYAAGEERGPCTDHRDCNTCASSTSYGDPCVWNQQSGQKGSCGYDCQSSTESMKQKECFSMDSNNICPRSGGGNNQGSGNAQNRYIPNDLQQCFQNSYCDNDYIACYADFSCAPMLNQFNIDYDNKYTPVRNESNNLYLQYYDCMARDCDVPDYGITLGQYESCDRADCSSGCKYSAGIARNEHLWTTSNNGNNFGNNCSPDAFNGRLYTSLPNRCSYYEFNNPYKAPTRSPTRSYSGNSPTMGPKYDKCIAFKVENRQNYNAGYGYCTYWVQDLDNSRVYTVSQYQTSNVNSCPKDPVTAQYGGGNSNQFRMVFNGRRFYQLPKVNNAYISKYQSRRLLQKNHWIGDGHLHTTNLKQGETGLVVIELDHPAHRDIVLEFDIGGEVDESVSDHTGHRHLTIKEGDTEGTLSIVLADGDFTDPKYLSFSLSKADGVVFDGDHVFGISTVSPSGVVAEVLDSAKFASLVPVLSSFRSKVDVCTDKRDGSPCTPAQGRRLLFGGSRAAAQQDEYCICS